MTRAHLVALAFALTLNACSCVDLSVAKPFPCVASEDDALQCPAGWRCGLEGRCFDAAVGAALVCTDSARHCATGWRCGAADSQGSARCQPVGVAGAYPCRDAADCEGGWQCDPVGQACVASDERLATSRLSTLNVDVVSPRLPDALPAHVAVGVLHEDWAVRTDPATIRQDRVVGFVSDGGVHLLVTRRDPPQFGGRQSSRTRRFPVDEAHLRQLATVGVRLVGLFEDGGVVSWSEDGGATALDLGGPAHRLASLAWGEGQRLGNTPYRYELAGLLEDRVVFLDAEGGAAPLVLDGGRPLDVSGSTHAALVLSTGAMTSVDLGSTTPVMDLVEPIAPGSGMQRLGLVGSDAGLGFRLALVQVATAAGQAWGVARRVSAAGYETYIGPCALCPFGAEALQVQYFGYGKTLVRCPPEPDGGLALGRSWWIQFIGGGGGCNDVQFTPFDDDESAFRHGVVSANTSLVWRAHGGAGGRAWYEEEGRQRRDQLEFVPPRTLRPVVLDRQPTVVTRLAEATGSSVVARAGAFEFTGSPLGLVSAAPSVASSSTDILGTVSGTGQLAITPQGVIRLGVYPLDSVTPQQVAAVSRDVVLVPPVAATLLPLATGTLLVVSSEDRLYGADVTAQLAPGGALLPPASLSWRLTPAAGVPIRDVAVGRLAAGDAGVSGLGSFYVLAREEVFGVVVERIDSWRQVGIPLPAALGTPRELWTEGPAEDRRGRVAYESGAISALPIAVPLAEALDRGQRVTDFARLCGDTVALVGTGLKRYASDAGWLDVPGVSVPEALAASARLYETGSSVFLATEDGRVLELYASLDGGLPVCPPPP